jgi:mono/diheme cytochrome c family protein
MPHSPISSWPFIFAGALLCFFSRPVLAADSPAFAETGAPFLEKHCVACHGRDKQKAGLALHEFRDDLSVLRARRRWREIIDKVQAEEMPADC